MKRIVNLFQILTLSLIIVLTSCQVFTKDGDMMYDYDGNYVLEAPVTNPSFTNLRSFLLLITV